MFESLKKELGLNNHVGSLHKYIYQKLKENSNSQSFDPNIKNKKQVFKVLSWYRIPKICRFQFLKEMEQFGLIEIKEDRHSKKEKCRIKILEIKE